MTTLREAIAEAREAHNYVPGSASAAHYPCACGHLFARSENLERHIDSEYEQAARKWFADWLVSERYNASAWSCNACGPHRDSGAAYCGAGCGRDYNRMEPLFSADALAAALTQEGEKE